MAQQAAAAARRCVCKPAPTARSARGARAAAQACRTAGACSAALPLGASKSCALRAALSSSVTGVGRNVASARLPRKHARVEEAPPHRAVPLQSGSASAPGAAAGVSCAMLAAAARGAPARAAPVRLSAPRHCASTLPRARQRGAPCRAGSKPADAPADAYAALAGRSVLRATDGSPVEVASLWDTSSQDSVALVVFLRSFG